MSPTSCLIALFCGGGLLLAPADAFSECTVEHERGGARPELSGPEQLITTSDGRFLIHWTAEGVDAPSNQEDSDGNGIPDFADRVLAGLLLGDTEFPAAGYRSVPPDDGQGGGPELDVYIVDLPANGYANQVEAEEGSDAASSCSIRLDGGLGGGLEGILESVALHEFHHCTQYAYTRFAPSWLLESSATYEQYRLYSSPALQAALEILWIGRLREPERPLESTGGRYEYAGFVFEFFWRSFNGPDSARLPALWEALRAAEGNWTEALDGESLRLWGQPFSRTFLDYATWNAFACGRDDGGHYEATMFPCELDTSVPVLAIEEGDVSLVFEDAPFTASYVALEADGDVRPVQWRCDGPGGTGARARLRLLALDEFGRVLEQRDVSARDDAPYELRLDQPQAAGGSTLAVLTSAGAVPASFDCSVERVSIAVAPPPPSGDGCSSSLSGAGVIWVFALGLFAPKRRRRRESPGAVE